MIKAIVVFMLILGMTSGAYPLGFKEAITISDNGRLYSAQAEQYVQPTSVEELQSIILEASKNGKRLSFAGQRHSQGGQTFCKGGIVIDMRSLNMILKIDPQEKIIVVQPGVTWEEIQNAVNSYGLAVKVMQASNIFTVGGSLSVNAHGRDARHGVLAETVRWIKVIKADGSIVVASRSENADLFCAAIGGYGLFGAIVEAELELTDNVVYRKNAKVMAVDNYPEYFRDAILGKADIGLHFARMNLSADSFMRELIAISYTNAPEMYCDTTLQPEGQILQNKMQLFLLRHSETAKQLRWPLEVQVESQEQILTRNQAMRPPVHCLSYLSNTNTDILQEYFISCDQFVKFAESFRRIATQEKINLLNVTIRYVPKDTLSLLPYAKSDSFAFVLYVTQGLSEKERKKAERWTGKLIDAALECSGTYYLPYQLYATREQLQKAYPECNSWKEAKQSHDPQNLFSNMFYEHYFSRW